VSTNSLKEESRKKVLSIFYFLNDRNLFQFFFCVCYRCEISALKKVTFVWNNTVNWNEKNIFSEMPNFLREFFNKINFQGLNSVSTCENYQCMIQDKTDKVHL